MPVLWFYDVFQWFQLFLVWYVKCALSNADLVEAPTRSMIPNFDPLTTSWRDHIRQWSNWHIQRLFLLHCWPNKGHLSEHSGPSGKDSKAYIPRNSMFVQMLFRWLSNVCLVFCGWDPSSSLRKEAKLPGANKSTHPICTRTRKGNLLGDELCSWPMCNQPINMRNHQRSLESIELPSRPITFEKNRHL